MRNEEEVLRDRKEMVKAVARGERLWEQERQAPTRTSLRTLFEQERRVAEKRCNVNPSRCHRCFDRGACILNEPIPGLPN